MSTPPNAAGQLLTRSAEVGGVLQAAGLLFFAFAGYARIATLGEEVRLVLAFSLPAKSVITGAAVLAIGAILWAARRTVRRLGRRYESLPRP